MAAVRCRCRNLGTELDYDWTDSAAAWWSVKWSNRNMKMILQTNVFNGRRYSKFNYNTPHEYFHAVISSCFVLSFSISHLSSFTFTLFNQFQKNINLIQLHKIIAIKNNFCFVHSCLSSDYMSHDWTGNQCTDKYLFWSELNIEY